MTTDLVLSIIGDGVKIRCLTLLIHVVAAVVIEYLRNQTRTGSEVSHIASSADP